MELLKEYVIVKVDNVFNEIIEGTKIRDLIMNVTYRPERNVRIWGIVVSVPKMLPRAMPITMIPNGMPDYYDKPKMVYKSADDIEMDVAIGDKVYFHYNCLLPDDMSHDRYNFMHLYNKKEIVDGVEKEFLYFRVKYELIFAAVRYVPMHAHMPAFDWEHEVNTTKCNLDHHIEEYEGEDVLTVTKLDVYMQKGFTYEKQVHMIGSYVLVEIDMETWEDVSIPTPESINGKILVDKHGQIVMKPKEQWLVRKAELGPKYLCGWVAFVGKPLKGDTQYIKPGMYVSFRPMADFIIRFEGKDYFRMMQRHVTGYIPGKSR